MGRHRLFIRLVDELRQRHPFVEIESCSSGGARIDMEVLKRTHRFWTSDTNDSLERQSIQRGFSYFFPPEIMGAHIGTDVSHTTGRRHTVAFRGMTALFGHLGMELDPASASEEHKAEFARYIALHKRFRSLAHSGDLVRFDYPDQTAMATGVIARDKNEAVITFAQVQTRTYTLSSPLRIPGLELKTSYRVSMVSSEQLNHTMKQPMPWDCSELVLTGQILEQTGIQMPVLWGETALVLHIEAI